MAKLRRCGLCGRRYDAPLKATDTLRREEPQASGPDTPRKRIFVFGSNLAGRHGKGSALAALQKHGAVYGQGLGLQGSSYAIATKDRELRKLPLKAISLYVGAFMIYARFHPELDFDVVAIGTGLAGYTHEEMGPLFKGAPSHVFLPREWEKYR